MKTAPELQHTVEQIAQKHGMDLDKPGAYLRLEQEAYGNLVIENIGGARISVTNYIQVGNDCIADPEIVVYADRDSSVQKNKASASDWYPIEVNQFFGGWQLCAELDLRGDLVVYDLEQQVEMVILAETTLAAMLVRQDWLKNGTRAEDAVRGWTPEDALERDVRVHEMDDVPF